MREWAKSLAVARLLQGLRPDTHPCTPLLTHTDPWVMREWAKSLGVSTERVAMLADGEGTLHCQLGARAARGGVHPRARSQASRSQPRRRAS